MRIQWKIRHKGRESRTFFWAIFWVAAIFPWVQGAADAARVFIDIHSPTAKKIRLAIPELRPLDGRRDALGLKIAKLIESDLRRTGQFFIPDRRGYLENPMRAGTRKKEQRFSQWSKMVRVEALIKGGYVISGNNITAELYLYDTLRSAQELGRRYEYSKIDWRSLAHRFANAVLERFTGEEGIFDTQLAFVSRRSPKERGEIYIMDWDGADPRRVTRNGMGNNAPAWSPDGRWLAYSSFKSKPPGVFLLPTSGARGRKVSSRRVQAIGGAFSPDSRYFAFAEIVGGNFEIFRYDLRARVKRRLTRSFGIDVSPSFSPDGKKIAFTSSRSGNPHVYVMALDGSSPRRITFKGKYNTEPDWSPRGDRIALTSRIKRGKEIDIATMNVDGSDLRRLTGGQGRNESPTWSPDGRHIAFSSDRSGRKYVYVMTSAGTQLKRLRPGQEPAWSPSSR